MMSYLASGGWILPQYLWRMAQQEPYWRGIFQVPSREDERQPEPKGPVKWSIVMPITITDVTNAIKGMTDGAPGPDGRTLNDLKNVGREELAAHCVAASRLSTSCPLPRRDRADS